MESCDTKIYQAHIIKSSEINKSASHYYNNSSLVCSPGMPPQAQILLKITRQKHTWIPVKKSKESNGDLSPSDPFTGTQIFPLTF